MFIRTALFAAAVTLAVSQTPEKAPDKPIELIRNQCVDMRKGDLVSLTMSPKPKPKTDDPRYSSFSLFFKQKGSVEKNGPKNSFAVGTQPLDNSVTPLGKGVYRLTFRMRLAHDVPPGEYTLQQVLVERAADGTGVDSISNLKTSPDLVEYCVRYMGDTPTTPGN